MVSITEDEKIRSVFHDIRWLEVQLNEKMRAGDKDSFFGFIKESNFLLVEDKIKYESKMTKLEKILDKLLYKLNRIEIRKTLEGLEQVKDLTTLRKGSFQLDEIWDELGDKIIDYHIKEGLLERRKITNFNLEKIIDYAADKEIISKYVSGEAHKIRKQANDILHKAKVATRQESKSALDSVLTFFEEIYFE